METDAKKEMDINLMNAVSRIIQQASSKIEKLCIEDGFEMQKNYTRIVFGDYIYQHLIGFGIPTMSFNHKEDDICKYSKG